MYKMRGHISNYVYTLTGGVGTNFITLENNIGSISSSPTNTEWFRRFMNGCHKKMGDVWIPDRAVTMQEVKEIFRLLEQDCILDKEDDHDWMQTTLTVVVIIDGFFGDLHGEEIIRMDLVKMREHWAESVTHENMHVPMMLSGCFKREIGENSFCQLLAWKLKSGVNIWLWFHCAL